MSDNASPDPSESPEPQRRSLRDNWWWSGALWLVGGGAVAYYQWPAISGQLDDVSSTAALVAVWVMAVVGVSIAVVGAWRLWRDWQVERARRAEAAAEEARTPPPASDAGSARRALRGPGNAPEAAPGRENGDEDGSEESDSPRV